VVSYLLATNGQRASIQASVDCGRIGRQVGLNRSLHCKWIQSGRYKRRKV
jgi:hypothetical protein